MIDDGFEDHAKSKCSTPVRHPAPLISMLRWSDIVTGSFKILATTLKYGAGGGSSSRQGQNKIDQRFVHLPLAFQRIVHFCVRFPSPLQRSFSSLLSCSCPCSRVRWRPSVRQLQRFLGNMRVLMAARTSSWRVAGCWADTFWRTRPGYVR